MADLGDVYDAERKDLATLVEDLSESDLARKVPATPDWSIKDVVAHVSANAVGIPKGDFPREFFEAMGSEPGVVALNQWTDDQIKQRSEIPLRTLLDEWETAAGPVTTMMRTSEWPEGILPFASHILVSDLAAHQQDVYGALGMERDRESAQVRIGVRTFIGGVDIRLQMSGGLSLRFVFEDKEVVAGGGDPQASVRGTRFELFRALTGRRSPDQVRALDWDGDPEPYLTYFFPYGVRRGAPHRITPSVLWSPAVIYAGQLPKNGEKCLHLPARASRVAITG